MSDDEQRAFALLQETIDLQRQTIEALRSQVVTMEETIALSARAYELSRQEASLLIESRELHRDRANALEAHAQECAQQVQDAFARVREAVGLAQEMAEEIKRLTGDPFKPRKREILAS